MREARSPKMVFSGLTALVRIAPLNAKVLTGADRPMIITLSVLPETLHRDANLIVGPATNVGQRRGSFEQRRAN